MESVSILFVLPSGGGSGGANSVAQEAMGLSRLGVDTRIGVNAANYAKLVKSYPEFESLKLPVLSYADADELAGHMLQCRIVVATTNASVYDIHHARTRLQANNKDERVRYAYYVQDYEPLFYPPDSDRWSSAFRSYTRLPDAMLFAKTQWLCDVVYANHGINVVKVKPSIDHDVYYPDLRRDASVLSIVAMMRPSTPRRAANRTLRITNAILSKFVGVSIRVFGSSTEQLTRFGIELPASVENWGVLRRSEVPQVLRSADMFLDLSDYQAFGRTALEGMACGCVPVVPILGGVSEFAMHGRNAFVVDTRSDDEIMAAVETFVLMGSRQRAEMRHAALETAADFTVNKAALSELRLFSELAGAGTGA
ncbi:MAG: glycosyltransferase family 4 protein [Enhydrobacter sp.]|nr:glycosyltransferase family 4 protein [Enhydrobacter sp.]